jgi:hypothetical protein
MLYGLRFRCCIASGLALSLAGCAIRPLPENHPLNFPRAATFDIVQRVRCEAKAGLESFKGRRDWDHVAKIIAATSIGFDFQFIMVENTNLTDGGLTFFRKATSPAPKGGLEVDLSGSATRERSDVRAFRVIEDLADVARADCSDFERPGPNLAYPISGSLRVDEVVRTYIQLEVITDLDDPKDDDNKINFTVQKGKKQRSGVFSETLEFNTKLTVGATPTLALSAVVGSFRLTHATVHGQAKRNDAHTLIVAFAQSPDFKDENPKARRARADRRRLIGKGEKVVRGARVESALAQGSSEHARNRVALELARVRNLLDDEQESARFLGKQLLTFMRPPDETGPGD